MDGGWKGGRIEEGSEGVQKEVRKKGKNGGEQMGERERTAHLGTSSQLTSAAMG